MPDIDSALRQAAGLDGLVVLADTADNAGGGAPSDNTALLQALLDKDVTIAGPVTVGARELLGVLATMVPVLAVAAWLAKSKE